MSNKDARDIILATVEVLALMIIADKIGGWLGLLVWVLMMTILVMHIISKDRQEEARKRELRKLHTCIDRLEQALRDK